MSKTKGGGSTRNGRDSNAQRLGVKAFGGTAVTATRGAPYRIAAKTGTAQVFSLAQGEKYVAKNVAERLRDHALFIAFAPADNP